MTDDDQEWLETVKRVIEMATGLLGGTFFVVAGAIGYDTGRRQVVHGVEQPTRWTGEVQWLQVVIGIALLLYGAWKVRQWRRVR